MCCKLKVSSVFKRNFKIYFGNVRKKLNISLIKVVINVGSKLSSFETGYLIILVQCTFYMIDFSKHKQYTKF